MEFEHGSSENPLKISWLQGKRSSKDDTEQKLSHRTASNKDAKQNEVNVL